MYRKSEGLQIRLTHKYVGPWKHLDEWEDLFATFLYNECPVFEDMSVLVGIIDKTLPREKAVKALRSVFNSQSCGCEYDCCGCRSTQVGDMLFRDQYIIVEIHHTINN